MPGRQRKPSQPSSSRRPSETCSFPGRRRAPDGPSMSSRRRHRRGHAQPAAQAPTQAQPVQHAPPTEQAQPAWAPTQSGTPEHVQQAWAATALGAPAPYVESASAPTQAHPAEDQRQASPPSPPDFATPDKWPDGSAPWPWWRRTAVVIPIAVVLIVAAVATILFVISGEEGPAPGGQAGGGGGSGGSGLDGTYAFGFGAPTQPNGQPFDNASGGDEKWVIKSACHTKGCVARATKTSGSITTATTLVLDEVDGRWDSVNARQGTCQGAGAGEVWESLSLESRPDGELQGKFIVRSTDPNCASNRPVTATRIGRRRLRRVGGRSRGDARPGGVAWTGAVWQLSGDRHVHGRESQRRREFRRPVVLPSYRRALPELLAEPQRHQGPHLREERVGAGQQVIGFEVHERRPRPSRDHAAVSVAFAGAGSDHAAHRTRPLHGHRRLPVQQRLRLEGSAHGD